MSKEIVVNFATSQGNPPKLKVSTSRVDFGVLLPNQVTSQHLLLENAGGTICGKNYYWS